MVWPFIRSKDTTTLVTTFDPSSATAMKKSASTGSFLSSLSKSWKRPNREGQHAQENSSSSGNSDARSGSKLSSGAKAHIDRCLTELEEEEEAERHRRHSISLMKGKKRRGQKAKGQIHVPKAVVEKRFRVISFGEIYRPNTGTREEQEDQTKLYTFSHRKSDGSRIEGWIPINFCSCLPLYEGTASAPAPSFNSPFAEKLFLHTRWSPNGPEFRVAHNGETHWISDWDLNPDALWGLVVTELDRKDLYAESTMEYLDADPFSLFGLDDVQLVQRALSKLANGFPALMCRENVGTTGKPSTDEWFRYLGLDPEQDRDQFSWVVSAFAECELPAPWTSYIGVGSIVCFCLWSESEQNSGLVKAHGLAPDAGSKGGWNSHVDLERELPRNGSNRNAEMDARNNPMALKDGQRLNAGSAKLSPIKSSWKHPFYEYFLQLRDFAVKAPPLEIAQCRLNRMLWSYEMRQLQDGIPSNHLNVVTAEPANAKRRELSDNRAFADKKNEPLVSPDWVSHVADILNYDLAAEPYIARDIKASLKRFAVSWSGGSTQLKVGGGNLNGGTLQTISAADREVPVEDILVLEEAIALSRERAEQQRQTWRELDEKSVEELTKGPFGVTSAGELMATPERFGDPVTQVRSGLLDPPLLLTDVERKIREDKKDERLLKDFVKQEKEILQTLFKGQTWCVECSDNLALSYSTVLEDYFCLPCFDRLHQKGHRKQAAGDSYRLQPCCSCNRKAATLKCGYHSKVLGDDSKVFCTECFAMQHVATLPPEGRECAPERIRYELVGGPGDSGSGPGKELPFGTTKKTQVKNSDANVNSNNQSQSWSLVQAKPGPGAQAKSSESAPPAHPNPTSREAGTILDEFVPFYDARGCLYYYNFGSAERVRRDPAKMLHVQNMSDINEVERERGSREALGAVEKDMLGVPTVKKNKLIPDPVKLEPRAIRAPFRVNAMSGAREV